MILPILKRFYLFWKIAQCNKKWENQVYQAVTTTKLLYGFEALCPCVSAAEKFNAFQLNGFRKIFEMQILLLTDEFIYNKCNQILVAPQQENDNKIKPLIEILETKRIELLERIIRRPWNHPQLRSTFHTDNLAPRCTSDRRVGRPRLAWANETMEDAWIKIEIKQGLDNNFEIEDINQRLLIKQKAMNYVKPFIKPEGT
jgi:hypothetical protein